MPLVPEITGIGSQINGAILTARAVAINMERELRFPDLSLKFFEKTPTTNTQLLERAVDWCARQARDKDGKFLPNEWEFEIINDTDLTDAVINKTTYFTVGSAKFKGVKRDKVAANLSIWRFNTEVVA